MIRKPWLGGLLLALLVTAPVRAESYRLGDLEIRDAWARASAPMQKNGAAYLTIVNHGGQSDRLVAVEGDVAGAAELHASTVDAQGVATMHPVDGIEVPAGGEVVLRPGELHIMLMDLRRPLAKGASFPLQVRFERAGTVAVQIEVRAARDMPAGGHGADGAQGHKAH
ncbi:copper chaperone PCu(A)C [Benzoatithermus flavus]|uniref:Copper chaperone PCu(A)C n=1 Tax=Benzoatithermus flavus TaxID=3108223 RepID=A0ABU8XTF1_9PROT